jgi:uncharacterized membrane protein YgcG
MRHRFFRLLSRVYLSLNHGAARAFCCPGTEWRRRLTTPWTLVLIGGLPLLLAAGLDAWRAGPPAGAKDTSGLAAGPADEETVTLTPRALEQAQRFSSQEDPPAHEPSALVAGKLVQGPSPETTPYEQVTTALKAAREKVEGASASRTQAEPGAPAARNAPESTGSPTSHFKRRRADSAEDLRQQLARAPELRLDPQAIPALVWSYKANLEESLAATGELRFGPQPLREVYPDITQLPLRAGKACRLEEKKAAALDVLSRKLRIYLAKAAPVDHHGKRPEPVLLREAMRLEVRGKQLEWLRPEAIPSLMQLLMHEDEPVRFMLVDLLAEIPGKAATLALAQRAVFDLSAAVREGAVAALQKRPRDEARPVFLSNLRHPWAPAADHAAEALVALGDQDAVPRLVRLLDQPDPTIADSSQQKQPMIREVVRVNHLANCLMCHPPSVTYADPVLGVVPNMTWQFPVSSQAQATSLISRMDEFTRTTTSTGTTFETGCHHYKASAANPAVNVPSTRPSGGSSSSSGSGSSSGSSGSGGSSGSSGKSNGAIRIKTSGPLQTVTVPRITTRTVATKTTTPVTRRASSMTTVQLPVLVRGDITYLRQDFSVKQPVELPGAPVEMRFDYLVRTRPATAAEMTRLREQPQEPRSFEQREAVLFALRELTGQDLGTTAAAWQPLLPKAKPASQPEATGETTRLVANFVRAAADRQDDLLAELRDSKGAAYTQALADVIPQLSGAYKVKAREALVDRLTRMTAATLRDKLQDGQFEIRRAAILACVQKNDLAHVPDLIDLLDDSEPLVRRVAETGLKTLTGNDLDAPGDANAWQAWWEQESSN